MLIALAMNFQFGSAHKAKGYPWKIPGFRHKQREQNERCRSDASRVIYAPIHGNVISRLQSPPGRSVGFGMRSDFIYPPPSGAASSTALF
jgi:hypothetical protein